MIINTLINKSHNDKMYLRLSKYLFSIIPDAFIINRICIVLRQSQLSIYVILTATQHFITTKKLTNVFVRKHELDAKCEINRFIFEKRRKEIERVLDNDYLLFVANLVIASKSFMDAAYTNVSWAEITHYTVKQINMAEKYALEILNYDIILRLDELNRIYNDYMSSVEVDENSLLNYDTTDKRSFLGRVFRNLFNLVSCVEI